MGSISLLSRPSSRVLAEDRNRGVVLGDNDMTGFIEVQTAKSSTKAAPSTKPAAAAKTLSTIPLRSEAGEPFRALTPKAWEFTNLTSKAWEPAPSSAKAWESAATPSTKTWESTAPSSKPAATVVVSSLLFLFRRRPTKPATPASAEATATTEAAAAPKPFSTRALLCLSPGGAAGCQRDKERKYHSDDDSNVSL